MFHSTSLPPFGFRFGNHFVYLDPPPPQFNSPLMQVSPVTHGADLWLLPRKPPERLGQEAPQGVRLV